MNLRKLDKIFEYQEKMIQVTLSSDPAKKSKKYKGFLVNEGPEALATGVGRTLSTIGNAYNTLTDINKNLNKVSNGDLSILAEIGEGMLANIIDRQTTKVSLFGKNGFSTVLITDDHVLKNLNNYNNKEVKEGFVKQVNQLIQIFEQDKQGEFPIGGPGITPQSAALAKVPQENPTQASAPETKQQFTFSKENMFFKLSSVKKYNKIEFYTLTPLRDDVKQALANKGIRNVALTRNLLENGVVTNECVVYFYYDAKNIIPQLTASNLKFSYDARVKAFLLESRFKSEYGPSEKIEYPLLVDENNFNILDIRQATHTIIFRMKPGAEFKNIINAQERTKIRKKFFKQENDVDIYAKLTAVYQVTKTGESITANVTPGSYVVDFSKIAISYGPGALKIPKNTSQTNATAATPQPATSPVTRRRSRKKP